MKAIYNGVEFETVSAAEKKLRQDLQKRYPNDFIDLCANGDGAGWTGTGYRVYKRTQTGRVGKMLASGGCGIRPVVAISK